MTMKEQPGMTTGWFFYNPETMDGVTIVALRWFDARRVARKILVLDDPSHVESQKEVYANASLHYETRWTGLGWDRSLKLEWRENKFGECGPWRSVDE